MRARYGRLRPWQRHSLVLAVLGGIYVAIGMTYILAAPTDTRLSTLYVPLSIAPLDFWGWLFAAVGGLSIISSRWPPASETWGYVALSTLSALWASFYLFGIIKGAPNSGLSGALLWGGVAFLWWAISGLQNPPAKGLPKELRHGRR